ncbi:hypothetical protein N7516_008152 [Penicillium verrucosum]|nr:hypothetical protein N7516_008152 [Penicillium verrucosum]
MPNGRLYTYYSYPDT